MKFCFDCIKTDADIEIPDTCIHRSSLSWTELDNYTGTTSADDGGTKVVWCTSASKAVFRVPHFSTKINFFLVGGGKHSMTTRLSCGAIFNKHLIANLLVSLLVVPFWNTVGHFIFRWDSDSGLWQKVETLVSAKDSDKLCNCFLLCISHDDSCCAWH